MRVLVVGSASSVKGRKRKVWGRGSRAMRLLAGETLARVGVCFRACMPWSGTSGYHQLSVLLALRSVATGMRARPPSFSRAYWHPCLEGDAQRQCARCPPPRQGPWTDTARPGAGEPLMRTRPSRQALSAPLRTAWPLCCTPTALRPHDGSCDHGRQGVGDEEVLV